MQQKKIKGDSQSTKKRKKKLIWNDTHKENLWHYMYIYVIHILGFFFFGPSKYLGPVQWIMLLTHIAGPDSVQCQMSSILIALEY